MNKAHKQMQKAKHVGMNNIDIARMKAIAKKEAEKMEQVATEKAFLYMLSIPLIILFEDYWQKTAKKKAPKFIEDVASLYESVQMGIVTEQQLADALYELSGVKIEAEWMKGRCKDEQGNTTTGERKKTRNI